MGPEDRALLERIAANTAQVLARAEKSERVGDERHEEFVAFRAEQREHTGRLNRAVFGSLPPDQFDRESQADDDEATPVVLTIPEGASSQPIRMGAVVPPPPPATPAILKRLRALEATQRTIVDQNDRVERKAFGTGAGALARAVRAAPTKDIIKILTLIVGILAAYGALRNPHAAQPQAPALPQAAPSR